MAVFHCTKSVNRLFIVTNRSITLKAIRNRHIEQITDIKFGPAPQSDYIRPFRMTYKENGKNKKRDIIDIRHFVLTLTYNINRKVLIFVKAFRPGLYHSRVPADMRDKSIYIEKYPKELGMIAELCSGIAAENKSMIQVAKEQVLEKCGYDVPMENFQIVHDYRVNVGISGSTATICYCEVTDKMKHSGFNSVDIIEMNFEEFEKHTTKPLPSCVLISYYWFKSNIKK